jgi:hypothetical protein
MGLNAATIQILIQKGLSATDLLDVARAMEAGQPKTAGAVRQARYRDRQKDAETVTSDVTRDVTNDRVSPNDNISNPLPVPITDVIGDPEKVVFASGVQFLGCHGVPEQKARSLIGKWKRDHGAPSVISMLSAAKREGAIEPISFIEAGLRTRAKAQAPPVWDGMP